jgi:hypothetical protein
VGDRVRELTNDYLLEPNFVVAKGAKHEEKFQNSLNFTLSSGCLWNNHRLRKRTVIDICPAAIR